MFVVLTQDDENIAILIYEQEITWMQLFWIRQCQFLLELLWILFTTSHQLALHEWKFRFIYFCNCKIIFFLSLVEKFRRHFCPKYCFGSRVFFFLQLLLFAVFYFTVKIFPNRHIWFFFFFLLSSWCIIISFIHILQWIIFRFIMAIGLIIDRWLISFQLLHVKLRGQLLYN